MHRFVITTTNETMFKLAGREFGLELANIVRSMHKHSSLRIGVRGRVVSGKTTFARSLVKPVLFDQAFTPPDSAEKWAYEVTRADANGRTHQAIFMDTLGMDRNNLRSPMRRHKGVTIIEHPVPGDSFDITFEVQRPMNADTNIVTAQINLRRFPARRLIKTLRDHGITVDRAP